MSDTNRRHLRVVEAPEPPAREQLTLPFFEEAFVLVLAHVSNASEQSFLWLLRETKPDVVIDLRLVPRFDFGRLNRKVAFHLFAEMSLRYHDLSHDLGISDRHDASFNPVFFAEHLNSLLLHNPGAKQVLVLLDDAGLLDRSLQVLPTRLSAPSEGRWCVRGVGRDHLDTQA